MWGPGRSAKLKGLGLASVLVWAKPKLGGGWSLKSAWWVLIIF